MKRGRKDETKLLPGGKRQRQEELLMEGSVPVKPQFAKALGEACIKHRKPELAQFLKKIKNKELEDTRKGICVLTDTNDIHLWQSGLQALEFNTDIWAEAKKTLMALPERVKNISSKAIMAYHHSKSQGMHWYQVVNHIMLTVV